MNEQKKTGVYVGVATLLLAVAAFASRSSRSTPADFNDQGTPFFPSFTLPEQATVLEVSEFDPETGTALPFNVALEKGRWVIPSHDNYPADARDRLGRTAAGILGLRRDTIRSDRPEDHRSLDVLDPLDPKATSPEGLGKRITLKDSAGAVLADLIVGKAVPGQTGQRFVRVPGLNRVYGVQLENVDLSTRFSDWIETNLLGIDSQKIETIIFDNHKVDPARGELTLGDVLTVQRAKPSDGPSSAAAPRWVMLDPPAGKEVNSQAVDTIGFTLADLRIVGVRPKPPGLTAELKADEGTQKLDGQAVRSLASKGFYVLQGRLLSSEGTVSVTCSDGIHYVLRFGGVTFARGEALSSGSREDDDATPAPSLGSEDTPDSAVESRYLFVTASFDPEVIPKPVPRTPGELPDDAFARTPAEREAEDKAAQDKAKQEQADYDKKVEDGKNRAKELTNRFAAWYYVVPGDAFRKIALEPSRLLQPVGASATTPTSAPPAFPSLPSTPLDRPFPPGLPGRT